MRSLALGCLGFFVAPVLLLVVIGAVANARPTAPTAARAPETGLGAPRTVASWSASGDKTTEPITLKGRSARIDLTLDRQVCISLRRVTDGQYVEGGCAKTGGPTYLYAGPGTYYIKVGAIGSWSATVTDIP